MMRIDESMTVGEVVAQHPHTARVFEKFGIDYCCGGKKSLREACQGANLPLENTLQLLQDAPAKVAEQDWAGTRLAELVEHIETRHHGYVRQETPRIERLLDKVCKVHGARHAELLQMQRVFTAMQQELSFHMMKEEQILFPFITELEQAAAQGRKAPRPPFGSVENPIRMMRMEHDSAGAALAELKALSNGYLAPADACVSYRMLFAALQEFEADLHQHVHLENNILFPRAESLEATMQGK